VVAFDTNTWHELHRTVLPSQRVMSPLLSARGLLLYIFAPSRATDPSELRSLDPLTGEFRTLYSTAKGFAPTIALSSDGSMVAFSETDLQDISAPTDVRVLDVESGTARTVHTFTSADPAGFTGRPVPAAWRSDERGFFVAGSTGTDTPGTWATVMLDGTVVQHLRSFVDPAPDGEHGAVANPGTAACADIQLSQHLALVHFDGGDIVNSINDPTGGIRPRGWSPAGDEFLYQQFNVPDVGALCERMQPEPLGRAFLLSVHGGPPAPVDNVIALRQRWYGDRIIDFECGGETAFNPYGDCVFMAATGHMFLNGREVTSGEVMRAIGFIEPRP
jgi:hypothetical protein